MTEYSDPRMSAPHYGFITMYRGDFKYAEETIFSDDPRYAAVHKLLEPMS